MSSLYEGFTCSILRVDLKTAEMIKYASNAALATKLSFINEIGNICKLMGIDVYQVAHGVGLDARISPHFLQAGVGFGGSCLPKDVKALIAKGQDLGYQPNLLKSVLQVNEHQVVRLVEMAEAKLGPLGGKKAAVLGLTFKPGTDDMREAPSLKVIAELVKRGVQVKAYDPVAEEKAAKLVDPQVAFANTAENAIKDADLIFILTEWDALKNPNLYLGKPVFAGRRVLEPEATKDLNYEGIAW